MADESHKNDQASPSSQEEPTLIFDDEQESSAGGERLLGCGAAALGLPLRRWDTIAIVLMTIAADVCLYSYPGGAGVGALFIVTGIGLLSLTKNARALNPLIAAALVLVSAAAAWNNWWLLVVTGWLSVIAFAIKLHQPQWRITELVWAALWTALTAPLKLVVHALRCAGVAVQARPGEVLPRGPIRWRVVLIPLLVVALFILIFVQANPIIEQVVSDISEQLGKWFRWLNRLFTAPRILSWLGWLLVFAALIRPAINPWVADLMARRNETLRPPRHPAPDRGDYSAALATLISVNVLFLVFNIVDHVYLHQLPEGTTYSKHAYKGCFWLTMGLALSTIVIGAAFKRRLNFHPRAGALRALSYVWALQNVALAVGALRRLEMYIGYNGLTRARIVGLYGVLLVVAGLALMVWKVYRAKNFTWLVRRDALALWVAVVLLALTPRDYVCAKYNTAQILSGNLRPLVLLHGQCHSPESYPPMIALLDYEHPEEQNKVEMEALVRRGVAGFLGRQLRWLRHTKPKNWTQWQGARGWALRRLEAVRDRLDVPEERWDYGDYGPAEEALRGYARQWW